MVQLLLTRQSVIQIIEKLTQLSFNLILQRWFSFIEYLCNTGSNQYTPKLFFFFAIQSSPLLFPLENLIQTRKFSLQEQFSMSLMYCGFHVQEEQSPVHHQPRLGLHQAGDRRARRGIQWNFQKSLCFKSLPPWCNRAAWWVVVKLYR